MIMTVGIEVIQETAIIVAEVIHVREAIFGEEIIHHTPIEEVVEAEREAGVTTVVPILQCQRKLRRARIIMRSQSEKV